MKNKFFKQFVALIVIILLFMLASFLADKYSERLAGIVSNRDELGLTLYFLLQVAAIVVAPFSVFPLLPVASALWGPIFTALVNIIAWTIGAVIAFGIARRWGQPILSRFINLQKIEKIRRIMPERHLFLNTLLLRLTVPVDILSYAYGLFVPIPLRTYIAATVLGISPFAFAFSYAATFPLRYQIVLGLVAVALVSLNIWNIERKSSK
ncbi:MAG: TVP38/TMEM64 family protein [Candidatus Taylorbacteria bacterium]|nr:TVP38/TMEM64 family protein [Candidatus Taylorbacteria bacterium]